MKKRAVMAILMATVLTVGMTGCGIGSAVKQAASEVQETKDQETEDQKTEDQKTIEELEKQIEEMQKELEEEVVEEEEELPEEEEVEEEEEKEVKKPSKAPASGELSDDIYDFQISIDGYVYNIPFPYTVFEANGFEADLDDAEDVPSMHYTLSDPIKFGKSRLYAQFMNFDINARPMEDCYIVSVKFDSYDIKDDHEIMLPKGITMGVSTLDDIVDAYGDPSDVYEGSLYTKYTYEADIYNSVDIAVDIETGTVSQIEIQNIVEPEDFEISEISTEVPEIISTYKAPTKMSDNALDYVVDYDGDLYQLPCPVSEFIDNGWKIMENDSAAIIEGSGSDKVTLMRNNQSFWTYVRNYDMNATAAENCYVQDLEANIYECDVDMEISGIKKGMSEDDLNALLEKSDYDYEMEDNSSYVSYSISDDRSYTYHVDIIVRDGEITGLSCQYDPRVSEYRKDMGLK